MKNFYLVSYGFALAMLVPLFSYIIFYFSFIGVLASLFLWNALPVLWLLQLMAVCFVINSAFILALFFSAVFSKTKGSKEKEVSVPVFSLAVALPIVFGIGFFYYMFLLASQQNLFEAKLVAGLYFLSILALKFVFKNKKLPDINKALSGYKAARKAAKKGK